MNNLTYLSNDVSQELKRQLARNCRREIAIIKYYPWHTEQLRQAQQLADVKRADKKKEISSLHLALPSLHRFASRRRERELSNDLSNDLSCIKVSK